MTLMVPEDVVPGGRGVHVGSSPLTWASACAWGRGGCVGSLWAGGSRLEGPRVCRGLCLQSRGSGGILRPPGGVRDHAFAGVALPCVWGHMDPPAVSCVSVTSGAC